MKTAEQILSNYDFDIHYYGDGKNDILKAMEEYANQSKQPPTDAIDGTHAMIKMACDTHPSNKGQQGIMQELIDYCHKKIKNGCSTGQNVVIYEILTKATELLNQSK